MTKSKELPSFHVNLLLDDEEKYSEFAYPPVTVIIPTFNCSPKISPTIQSIMSQDYPDFEVIIVDGGSTDQTIPIIKNFQAPFIQIHTVSTRNRYEMLNKGISHSKGLYINVLFPGDTYLHPQAIKHMMHLALDGDKPPLIYCGVLLRSGTGEPKILSRALTLDLMQKGMQPTAIQGCWIRANLFRKLGMFAASYTLRGGYELLCRFLLLTKDEPVRTTRVLVDCDIKAYDRKSVTRHFFESFRTIYRYFGGWNTFRWLFHQRDITRYIQLWMKSFKRSLLGP